MTPKEIRQLLARPTITPHELYLTRVLPLTRNGVYDAIKRGEIEVLEFGKKKAIVTASLRRKLGLDGQAA
jgi:hypothetical protein